MQELACREMRTHLPSCSGVCLLFLLFFPSGCACFFYYFFFFRILIKKLVLIPAERESVWDSRRREGHAETGGRGVGSERCLLLSPSLSQPQVRSTGRAQPLPALSPFLPSPPPTHTLVVFKFNLGSLKLAFGALKHEDHHCDLWPVADTLSL